MTTNLDPKDIRKRYGGRIADRLNEMMAKIVYRNPTYRMDEIQTDGMRRIEAHIYKRRTIMSLFDLSKDQF